MKGAFKMFPSIKLLFLMLFSIQCCLASGFSLFGIAKKPNEGQVIDLTPKTADLGPAEVSWLTERSLNEKQLAKRLAKQKLEGLSSQNNPIASLPYTNQNVLSAANYYWNNKASLVPFHDGAGDAQASQSHRPGKRRLDDSTALASNAGHRLQQLRGSRLVQQQHEQLMLNEARQNEQRLGQLQFDERMMQELHRRMLEQEQSQRQQANRRMSLDDGDQMARQSRYLANEAMRGGGRRGQQARNKQHVTSPQKIVDNGERQESRKRPTRPLVSRSKVAGRSNNKGDDIFNDDDDDGSEGSGGSERRSADGDEDEDADEPEDDSQANDGGAPGRKVRGHKLSASSPVKRRQPSTRSENNPITRGQSNDIDEDIDSSNARANLMALDNQVGRDNRREAREVKKDIGGGQQLPSSNAEENNLDENRAATQQQGQVSHSTTDLKAAAGHHHGHHGHYYQYVEVPKKKAWKFGFKRGNHKHEIEKHEKGHKHKFHTTFKWHAKEKCKKKKKCKSVGKMTWEYKHAKKHHHHG